MWAFNYWGKALGPLIPRTLTERGTLWHMDTVQAKSYQEKEWKSSQLCFIFYYLLWIGAFTFSVWDQHSLFRKWSMCCYLSPSSFRRQLHRRDARCHTLCWKPKCVLSPAVILCPCPVGHCRKSSALRGLIGYWPIDLHATLQWPARAEGSALILLCWARLGVMLFFDVRSCCCKYRRVAWRALV